MGKAAVEKCEIVDGGCTSDPNSTVDVALHLYFCILDFLRKM